MTQWLGVISPILATLIVLAGVLWSGGQTQGNVTAEILRVEQAAVQYRQTHDMEHVREESDQIRRVEMLLEVRLWAVRNEERLACQKRIDDLEVLHMQQTRRELEELQLRTDPRIGAGD